MCLCFHLQVYCIFFLGIPRVHRFFMNSLETLERSWQRGEKIYGGLCGFTTIVGAPVPFYYNNSDLYSVSASHYFLKFMIVIDTRK